MAKLLVIDNYDSFTYNLVQMFMHYDLEIHVYRSDKITLEEIETLDPDYALISDTHPWCLPGFTMHQ
jgi:anthranilate synthase component 2